MHVLCTCCVPSGWPVLYEVSQCKYITIYLAFNLPRIIVRALRHPNGHFSIYCWTHLGGLLFLLSGDIILFHAESIILARCAESIISRYAESIIIISRCAESIIIISRCAESIIICAGNSALNIFIFVVC